MRFLNNWIIVGASFNLWFFSLLFMHAFGSVPIIGNEGYVVRTICIAILPVLASFLMYGLELLSLPSRKRNKVVVHLTYLAILGAFIPLMWTGMQGTLDADDAPDGIAVDLAAVAALISGTAIFWSFRVIEVIAKSLQQKQNAA